MEVGNCIHSGRIPERKTQKGKVEENVDAFCLRFAELRRQWDTLIRMSDRQWPMGL